MPSTPGVDAGRKRILIVDDDQAFREMLAEFLRGQGYGLVEAATAGQALVEHRRKLTDLVFLDLSLPDMHGLELLPKLHAFDPAPEIVVVTGEPGVDSAIEALKLGAYDYLTKPVHLEKVQTMVARILSQACLREEVHALRSRLAERLTVPELIAVSPAMIEVKRLLAQVSPTTSTVVIEGETGTGKEVVAATVHRLSPRRDRPFVAVNCGAIPAELVESELFGHVRGAFSGALTDSPGLFRTSDTGTLFLDEILELTLSAQVKLLRVLQSREVRPVGSSRVYPVDVRLVAATNEPLEVAVKDGRLRQDLLYRLNVVAVKLPPLRERREDIAALATHFIRGSNARFGRRVAALTPQAIAALEAYSFPGNVRELEHLIERAFALGADDLIGIADLPPLRLDAAASSALSRLEQAERDSVAEALAMSGHDREAAARTLGISRRTLYRRLKQFDLA